MAAYIPVPRDLTRVKSKILFNLTKRQLLCFGAGALIGVPSFFLLKYHKSAVQETPHQQQLESRHLQKPAVHQ